MRSHLSILPVFGLVFLVSCQPSDQQQSAETQATAPAVIPDDAEAVAGLEAAGCRLTKDEAGLVTEISVSSDTDFTETATLLAGLKNVRTARFGGPGMNDAALAGISALKTLRRLDLTDASAVGDGTLQVAGQLPVLDVLILRRSGFTDAGLQHIQGLKLRAIDLRNTNTTDAGVALLKDISTLVDVQLEKSKVTDEGVNHLCDLPLKSLNLNYTAVTDGALEAIGQIATLEQLQMEASRITDEGMAHLANLKKLRRLSCRLADVSGVGIAHLASCTALDRLELRETSIDDEALEVISKLPALKFLDISENRLISSDGIAMLGKLTSLTYLELREVKKVRDECFAALAPLTELTELNLEATRITADSLPVILGFQKLRTLNMAGTQLDDADFVQLGQLPELRVLDLTNCEASQETADALKAALPALQIKGI
ncbi:MAG: leucine-rich repeat domain-containing protein [Planctomycetaceae bacterium]